MEINAHLEILSKRIVQLEVGLKQEECRADAQELVLAWILARFPYDDVHRFLAVQANNMEGNPKHQEDVALLDHLQELVSFWHAFPASDPKIPR